MTSYPSNIYSPTNPSGSSPRNSPSLAGEVSGLNNEVVAIETALGTHLSNVAASISVPVGDTSKITTSVTYTDPPSGDSVKVLTFTEDTAAIAFAVEGDTYPEVVIRPDTSSGEPVMAFSDGTFDPMLGPNGEQNGFFWNSDPTYGLTFELNSGKIAESGPATDCQATFPQTVGHVLNVIVLAGNAWAQEGYGPDGGYTCFFTGAGSPNTLDVPGNLNDVYVNSSASVGVGAHWLWRCTSAGSVGTWVAQL